MKVLGLLLLAMSSSLSFASNATNFEIRRITVENYDEADYTRRDCVYTPGSLTQTLEVYGSTFRKWDALTVDGDFDALLTDIHGAVQPPHAAGDHFVNYWVSVAGCPPELLRGETSNGVVTSASPNAAKLVRIMNRVCQ